MSWRPLALAAIAGAAATIGAALLLLAWPGLWGLLGWQLL